MALYYPSMMQTFPYTYMPLAPTCVSDMAHANMYPSAQMHNFYSRPLGVVMDRYNGNSANQMEYHQIYGANPYYHSYPFWQFPQVNPFPLYNPYPTYRPYAPYQRPGWEGWPEGSTLVGELRWGRLERVVGPRRDLPEFVKDDLRRVYGTYPRTDVSITYHNGEFIVKGDPFVGEQEYKIEKRIIRKDPTPTASDVEDSSEDRSRKKKKKSKR